MERRKFIHQIGSFMVFPSLGNLPNRIDGVEFSSLKKPVVMTSRYPTWTYRPKWSTVIPIRGVPGKPPDRRIIQEQNNELNEFNIDVDIIQFNPNPEVEDWKILRQNYLPAQRDRPFFLLYEHHFGTRYRWEQDGNVKFINLGNPYNRAVFFQDIEFMLANIAVPNRKQYVTFDGRAAIYMWATPIYKNAGPVFREAKKKYPVFLIGGEDPYHFPKRSDAIERVLALDAVMPYGTNRAGRYVGRYNVMIDEYIQGLYMWSLKLREYDSLHIKLFTTVMFAFDHSNAPERRLPPFYPRSINDVVRLCKILRSFISINSSAMYGKPDDGVHVVYDELFEGSAIEQSFPPQRNEPNWRIRTELSGLTRLQLMKEFFS